MPSGATGAGPPAVDRAAAERGLGALVDVRRQVTPLRAVTRGVAGVVGCVVLLLVVGAIGVRLPNPSWARTLSLWLVVALLGLLLYAMGSVVRALVLGTRAHYLFTGGLVHRRRGSARAVAWADVDRLVPVYNRSTTWSAGKLLGYRVLAGGNAVARIPLVLVGGRDAFVDRIFESLGVPGGSAGAPAPYQGVSDEQREIWRAHGARSMVGGGLWLLLGGALLANSVSRTSWGSASLVVGGAVVFGAYRIVTGYLVNRKADQEVAEEAGAKAWG